MTHDSNEPHVKRTNRVAFGMVDVAVIRDESLPTAVRTVYTYLATFCSDTRSAYPSRARIARGTGLSVRTVDGALATAGAVGLLTVQHRRKGKVNETNLYLLHDLGGGYVVGSGPRGVVQELHQGVVQDVHQGGAGAAPELDQGSTQVPIQTTDNASSGDAYAAVAPRASSQGSEAPDVRVPPDFPEWSDGRAAQYLVKATIRAMTERGLKVDGRAGDAMGRVLKRQCTTRDDMIRNARYWLSIAGTDEPNGGWIARWPVAS